MLKIWTGYRMSDTLSAELAVGQVQGTYSGTNFWQINVLAEPWSFMDGEIDLTWAPGIGRSDTSFGAMIGY